jgi:hypothetical protein
MTEAEYARKLDELDRLLNDPDVPMEPARVWSLLAELADWDFATERAAQGPAVDPAVGLSLAPRLSGTPDSLPGP